MKEIFLHTGWRTAGTWLWEQIRAQPNYMGFYEPLHEALPKLTPEKIGNITPASWGSRHGLVSKPYFQEYLPLLRTGQRGGKSIGVRGASLDFSFDRFFMADYEPYEALKNYVQLLCDTAHEAGQIPVLKFVRSQGRLPWFRAQFPDQLHVLVARQPWNQFRSGYRFLTEHNNSFFLAAPCLVLERNAAHPDVARLINHLDLPVRPGRRGGVAIGLRIWSRAVKTMPLRTLYRMHLALWMLNLSRGLPAADLVVDGEADAATISTVFGANIAFDQRAPLVPANWATAPSHCNDSLSGEDVGQFHACAMNALERRLDPQTVTRIGTWLQMAEATANFDLRKRPASVSVKQPTFGHWAKVFLRAKPVRSL